MLITILNKLQVIGIIVVIVAPIAALWANGIDKMSREHPDYKGEDLFNENYKEDEK